MVQSYRRKVNTSTDSPTYISVRDSISSTSLSTPLCFLHFFLVRQAQALFCFCGWCCGAQGLGRVLVDGCFHQRKRVSKSSFLDLPFSAVLNARYLVHAPVAEWDMSSLITLTEVSVRCSYASGRASKQEVERMMRLCHHSQNSFICVWLIYSAHLSMYVGYTADRRKEMPKQETNEINLQFSFGPVTVAVEYAGGAARASSKWGPSALGMWPDGRAGQQLTYSEWLVFFWLFGFFFFGIAR